MPEQHPPEPQASAAASHAAAPPRCDEDDEDLRYRPLWQRLLLPFVGLLCMLVAAISGFLPFIPGWPLALIGAPLLAAFNPRYEAWVRRRMRRAWRSIRHRFGHQQQAPPEHGRHGSSHRLRRQPSPSD